MNPGALLARSLLVLLIGLAVWLLVEQRITVRKERQEASEEAAARQSNPVLLFESSLLPVPSGGARPVRATVYVPAYAVIRASSGQTRIKLATTLSIHNSSRDKPLVLERVDYHNTEGDLVQGFLEQPVALKPFGTMEMFIPEEDVRGGTGANFVVDWTADGPTSEPVVEAIMIGALGTTSYSFVSQGRTVRMVP